MTQEKTEFLKNHGDAIVIIASVVGINIALGAILIGLFISNSAGITACNARIDSTLSRIDYTISRIDRMYEILMNCPSIIPSQSFRPYHDEISQPNDWMIKDTRQGK